MHIILVHKGISALIIISLALRTRVSRALTANGLVYGNSTESTSLNRSPKNLSTVITSTTSTVVQNLVEIPRGGLLGK